MGAYMQQSTLVTVRVKPEVAIRLEKLATSMDRSKSWLAAEAIEEYLDIHEWQIQAINEGIAAADRGETVNFDEIKKYWEKRIEDSSH
jgi:RHH-type rel operon transcriptional repressor/antitoxin RelB